MKLEYDYWRDYQAKLENKEVEQHIKLKRDRLINHLYRRTAPKQLGKYGR